MPLSCIGWKQIAGKKLSKTQVAKLIKEGKTGKISGFKSKSGKEFEAALKLNAGKYTLVAFYDHDDFAFTSTTVNFEVYKANPTISVPDVEVELDVDKYYDEDIDTQIEKAIEILNEQIGE